MNTLLNSTDEISVGKIIQFREREFENAKKYGLKIKTFMESIISSHTEIGIDEEITVTSLASFVNGSGIDTALDKYREEVKTGMKSISGISNQVLSRLSMNEVDQMFSQLYKKAGEVKRMMNESFSACEYSFSCNDFEIVDNTSIELKEDPIRDFFTIKIVNEKQVEFFKQMLKLEAVYNESVQMVEQSGVTYGSWGRPLVEAFRGNFLLNHFFKFEVIDTDSRGGDIVGSKIHFVEDTVSIFK